MNKIEKSFIFHYQFVPKLKSSAQIEFFIDTNGALFASSGNDMSFSKKQELNTDFLNDIKEYIDNIIGSDWEQEYKGKLERGNVEFKEIFSFRNGKKSINISVENGNRPRILEDYLLFLTQFYPNLPKIPPY